MNRACLRPIMSLSGVLAILLLTIPAGTVLAQPVLNHPVSDPAVDGARAAFEALPEADRKSIQDDLIWTGNYSGMADGAFGRQTYDAIVARQKDTGKPADGILGPADRAALQAAAQHARTLAGFTTVDDPRTGIRLGLPGKLLPVHSENPSGSRWQSQDGRITLDTRTAPADATLPSLYARNLAIKAPGRIVSYKVLRPDFLVIAGETPTGKFYTRYAAGPDGIRGFSIGYDKTLAQQVDPLVVAIANAFEPFPATPPPIASAPIPSPAATSQTAGRSNGSGLIGTGIVVGPHRVLTTAAIERCKSVRVGTLAPQHVAGHGPYLIELSEELKAPPAVLSDSTLEPGAPILVLAFTDDGGDLRLTATAGTALSGRAVLAPLQPGASGAPVLDADNRLVALAAPVAEDGRRIAGILTSARHTVIPVGELSQALPGASTSGSGVQTITAMQRALVPITCVP